MNLSVRPLIILDTDLGNDVDDALALAMLHTLADKEECEFLGVTLTNTAPAALRLIRLINRYYGRNDLPVRAAIKAIPGGDMDTYPTKVLAILPEDEQPAPAAPDLLEELLAAASRPVVIVLIGFSTNLATLLQRPGGRELVSQKVERVVAMAGNFASESPENNVMLDIPSARDVFEGWPSEIIFSDFELGLKFCFPASAVDERFAYDPLHPVAISYRHFLPMPYDRPLWDLTAVLHAVRRDAGYFSEKPCGGVEVDDIGVTRISVNEGHTSRAILEILPGQDGRILSDLIDLTTAKPKSFRAPPVEKESGSGPTF